MMKNIVSLRRMRNAPLCLSFTGTTAQFTVLSPPLYSGNKGAVSGIVATYDENMPLAR